MPGAGVILMHDGDPISGEDIRHKDRYPFPVQYDVAKGVDINKFINEQHKILYLPAILKAAQRLKNVGSQVIMSECGYFAFFQREVSASLKIPTYLSSLVQLPLVQTAIGGNQYVGVIVARSDHWTEHHMISMGVKIGSNYKVFGLLDENPSEDMSSAWTKLILGEKFDMDIGLFVEEIISKCQLIIEDNPNLGAIVLDTTGLPPFAGKLRRVVDLPVFNLDTLLNYATSSLRQ